jgi:hypothetical protein
MFPQGIHAFPWGNSLFLGEIEQFKPFSLRNNHIPREEGTLLLGELGPFSKENSLLLKKLYFSLGNFFTPLGKLAWDQRLILFA